MTPPPPPPPALVDTTAAAVANGGDAQRPLELDEFACAVLSSLSNECRQRMDALAEDFVRVSRLCVRATDDDECGANTARGVARLSPRQITIVANERPSSQNC